MFLSLLVISVSLAQQFYKSKGLSLFNQGNYNAAIDSLLHWADIHTGESGIAYYYVGECYYNSGLDAATSSQAIAFFKKGITYFDKAVRQADLLSLYPEKKTEAVYKKAWSYYRLAELEKDPLPSLMLSNRTFTELSVSPSDTIGVYALYMAGETRLRIANWKRIQMLLSANVGESIILAKEALQNIKSAENAFKQVANSRMISNYLKSCALLEYQNSLFGEGKIYQKMGLIKGKISGNTKLKGFPIFTKMEMDTGMGKMNVETTTTKIVPSSIPDKEFELPKGYKKIETNMMF